LALEAAAARVAPLRGTFLAQAALQVGFENAGVSAYKVEW